MVSIGSVPSFSPGFSPRDQAISVLNAQVSAGEITSDDKDAMLSALDAIHQQRMEAGPPPQGSTPPTQEDMQANFESLLSDQVEAGTLTQDQADELSSLFESGELAPPPPPPGGPGGPGGPVGSEGSGSSIDDLMSKILEELQSQSGYDETGGTSSNPIASLLANFTV